MLGHEFSSIILDSSPTDETKKLNSRRFCRVLLELEESLDGITGFCVSTSVNLDHGARNSGTLGLTQHGVMAFN